MGHDGSTGSSNYNISHANYCFHRLIRLENEQGLISNPNYKAQFKFTFFFFFYQCMYFYSCTMKLPKEIKFNLSGTNSC